MKHCGSYSLLVSTAPNSGSHRDLVQGMPCWMYSQVTQGLRYICPEKASYLEGETDRLIVKVSEAKGGGTAPGESENQRL